MNYRNECIIIRIFGIILSLILLFMCAAPKLITVPSILVLSEIINKSLDSSYCMTNSEGYHDCVSTENRYFSGVNLTYHVPLSKYWNEVNLSLIFK